MPAKCLDFIEWIGQEDEAEPEATGEGTGEGTGDVIGDNAVTGEDKDAVAGKDNDVSGDAASGEAVVGEGVTGIGEVEMGEDGNSGAGNDDGNSGTGDEESGDEQPSISPQDSTEGPREVRSRVLMASVNAVGEVEPVE